ncbi:hypothetical protein M885DRAFT_518829 [Pelagophyceae sp. CCMP2097]|nr:hypothetical protein M885DRAFT_518829 [Pelagophyceae sp. CCMP2097]|mmetsp:Transcript_4238/g.14923  ORF Transcript_4238/g.14923 Transcript_4238/m.14923 type:complete len:220 (-) Transcript_4238:478-1137(-)
MRSTALLLACACVASGLAAGRKRQTRRSVSLKAFKFPSLFDLLLGGEAENFGTNARDGAAALSRQSWLFDVDIGAIAAKRAGGSGVLAKSARIDSPSMCIGLTVGFEIDARNEPPSGPARAVESKFFGEGFVTIVDDANDGTPQVLRVKLDCPKGLTVTGETLVEAGEVYFTTRLERRDDGTFRLFDGIVGVREASSGGILAELKIVGTFEARPTPPTR